jgi:outer membrane autotransporter protein
LTEHLVTGLAFNYINTSSDYSQSAGHMNSDTYMGAFYGSYYLPKDFYVDWLANVGGSNSSFNRQFAYSGFQGQANSRPSGNQYGFALNSGKDFSWLAWTFAPYTRFEYINLNIDAYQERGGTGMDVSVNGQANQSFTSDLGVQLSRAFSLSWGVITPALRAEWEHQYLNNNRSIQMRLSDASPGLGNFVIATGNPDRDYMNLGGSVSATLPNGRAVFIHYQTRLGQAAISEHIVEAGVRLEF